MTQSTIDLGRDEEHQKNDHPISTRETIYAHLETAKTFNELFDALSDPNWAKSAVHKRVLAMCRDEQLVIQDEIISHKEPTHLKRVKIGAKGNDKFINIDGMKLVLTDRHAQGLFPNDEVTVRLPIKVSEQSIPIVVSVHSSAQARILCVVKFHRGRLRLTPFDQRIKQPLVLHRDAYYEEDTVVSVIRKAKQKSRRVIGVTVESVVGHVKDTALERVIAKSTYGLADAWDENYQVAEASQLNIDQIAQSRESWIELPFVTIDGEDAKDYDDAVYCEKTDTGYRLYVAIADVSHYVTPDTELDKEARARGNSVYLPGHVIPMLPEILSNQACSLLPNVNRLAMGCVIDLDHEGRRLKTRLAKVAIKSHARLTYEEVAKMLLGEASIPSWFEGSLQALDACAKALRARRVDDGTIILRSHETKFQFGDNGEVSSLFEVDRLWSHQLIEECMLCANMAVGRLMHESSVALIYRAHSEPLNEKVNAFQSYLKFHNIDLPDNPTPKDLQSVLDACQGKPDFHAIEMMVLRTLSQAFYSSEEISHYALSTDYYTHFTSPIRRYVDLTVHRAISTWLEGKAQDQVDFAQIAQDCSVTERNADEASWFAQAWLKAKWMEQHLGKVFNAKVSSVTHFGIFVALKELPVEGLVHISMLGNEYYTYHEDTMSIVGNDSTKSYCLGDSVKVRLSTIDLALQRVDFEITS